MRCVIGVLSSQVEIILYRPFPRCLHSRRETLLWRVFEKVITLVSMRNSSFSSHGSGKKYYVFVPLLT